MFLNLQALQKCNTFMLYSKELQKTVVEAFSFYAAAEISQKPN